MRGGKLRTRMRLEQESRSSDGQGGDAVTWTLVATIWGALAQLNAQEKLAAAQLDARVTHLVTIRFRAGVTSAMRLVTGTRVFNILTYDDTENRHRELVLQCEERQL